MKNTDRFLRLILLFLLPVLFSQCIISISSSGPASASCGDSNLDAGEECDDGNLISGDGCSKTCKTEGLLDLAANTTTVTAGYMEQFSAFYTDLANNVSDVTSSVTYHVSDSSVGYFASQSELSGMFVALKGGSVGVYAKNANGLISNTVTINVVYPATAGSLLINEIYDGHLGYYLNPWIEIINTAAEPANLSLYQLRSRACDSLPSTCNNSITFDLPDMTIPPGGYILIIRKGTETKIADSLQVLYLFDGSDMQPWLDSANGFVELLKAGVTQDFIRWGSSLETPATASHWDASSAPALPTAIGSSLGRDGSSTDTNTGSDWSAHSYVTKTGPNDVTCDVDADIDGIPDCSELPGSTFSGLPLYDWGARQGQRDIFVEIDYMPSTVAGKILHPERNSLDPLVTIFANRGFTLHFDVGDLYDQSPGINPANHDLGGGGEVPYHPHISVGGTSDGVALSVHKYRNEFMDLRRYSVFHYALFGDQSPPNQSFGGQAQWPGNELVVTYGHYTPGKTYTTHGRHGGVLMHELGHNLGLGHGGNEALNYKPNYVSTMNYMYSGPPNYLATADEGFKYFILNFGWSQVCSPAYDPVLYYDYNLDYSSGTMLSLDENNLDETNGLSGSGFGVDFNCNGIIETGVSYNLNPLGGSNLEVLHDHDDWGNLNLRFIDHSGFDLGRPAGYKVASETPAEVRRNDFIKRGKLKKRELKKFKK